MPLNYDQSKVYKIWSPQGDKIYVGSTTKQYLSQRMTAHRNNYNVWKSGKCPLTTSFLLFDEYGLDNCCIELLEAKSCSSKDELKQLEGGYIRNLACVNKRIENRDNKEYNKQYREINKEKIKEYKEDNKERIKNWQKEYQEINKEKIKQYYEANKESINNNKKIYYEKTKDIQSSLKNLVFECSCGKSYTQSNRVRHQKSSFHINNKKE